MSFVSVVARENFITLMSDGRVIRNGESIEENYQKFIKINENFFIAYAGDKEKSEMLLKTLEIGGVYSLFDKPNFDIIDVVLESLVLKTDMKNFNVMLAYGGINNNNEVVFSYLSTKNDKSLRYSPKGQDINYCFLNNGVTDGMQNEKKFVEYLRQTGLEKPQEIIKTQKLLNDYIAGLDKSVNTNTFELIINRKAALTQ